MRRGSRAAGDETGHRRHRRLFGHLMSEFQLQRLGTVDNRMGVACLDLPNPLPPHGGADPSEVKV